MIRVTPELAARLASLPQGAHLHAQVQRLRRAGAASDELAVDSDVEAFLDQLDEPARLGPPAATMSVLTAAIRRDDLGGRLSAEWVTQEAVRLLTSYGVDVASLGYAPVHTPAVNLIETGAR